MQFSSQIGWVWVGTDVKILVSDEITLSKLGIGDLFNPFAKTPIYIVFHLYPILFKGGYFLSHMLITKTPSQIFFG